MIALFLAAALWRPSPVAAAPLAAPAVSGAAVPLPSKTRGGPERVLVGAYLNDIQNLDLKTHGYALDLYIWFRWKDPKLDPSAAFEFLNPSELWGHVKVPAYEKPKKLSNGEYYQVVRHQGRFTNKLKLDSYPFDRQILSVEFEDSSRDEEVQVFYTDPKGLAVNPRLELPGFDIGAGRIEVQSFAYPTDFGHVGSPGKNTYSRVRIEVPIARPMATYTIKLLTPVLCVIFCAALMFLFGPQHLDARIGIGITALLTIVALQITLNDDLPEVAYLVLMDKIYLGAYLFVIAGLGVVVITTRMLEAGDPARAARWNRWSLTVLTSLYLASTTALILVNL